MNINKRRKIGEEEIELIPLTMVYVNKILKNEKNTKQQSQEATSTTKTMVATTTTNSGGTDPSQNEAEEGENNII